MSRNASLADLPLFAPRPEQVAPAAPEWEPEPGRVVKTHTLESSTILRTVDDLLCSTPLRWWSIPELRRELARRSWPDVLDTTISARIRELRCSPYNRYVRNRVRAGTSHLHEYAVAEVAS